LKGDAQLSGEERTGEQGDATTVIERYTKLRYYYTNYKLMRANYREEN